VLVLAVLAHLISPAEFGVVSAALVVIGFSAIFSQLGLGPALVQRPELAPEHEETAFAVSVLLGLVLAGIVWWLAPVVADFFRIPRVAPVLRVLAWIFPLQGLGTVAESLMRRDLRFRWLANVDVITYAFGYGLVGIALALAGWGVWALVAGQIAQTLLDVVLLLACRPPRIGLPGWRAFTDLVRFGGGFTIALVASFFALQGDNLVVGRWLGPAALGLYDRAFQLMSAPATNLGMVLDNVLFPTMARVQGEQERLAVAYRRGVSLIALCVVPVSAVLMLIAPEIIHVILGPRWGAAVLPFRILAIGMLFRSSYRLSDSLARATGAVYRRAWRTIVYAALVIGGAWIGQHWGIAGVAVGSLFALAVNFVLMAQLSLHVSGITWRSYFRAHTPAIMLTAASLPVVWVVVAALRHWRLNPIVVVSITAGASLIWSLSLTWLAPTVFLGRDARWMLDTLRALMPKPFGSLGGSSRASVVYRATRTGEMH
jgi:PST family polysaccharide transporter